MDYCCDSPCVVHDTAGACAVLRRSGSGTQCAERVHAMLCHCLFDERSLVYVWVFNCLRGGLKRSLGRV